MRRFRRCKRIGTAASSVAIARVEASYDVESNRGLVIHQNGQLRNVHVEALKNPELVFFVERRCHRMVSIRKVLLNFLELITNALSKMLLLLTFKRCREPWQKELVQAIDCGLDGLM